MCPLCLVRMVILINDLFGAVLNPDGVAKAAREQREEDNEQSDREQNGR